MKNPTCCNSDIKEIKPMQGKVPHIVQYQGSKRILASQIMKYMPKQINRMYEPFSGMASITIAAATKNLARTYHINDINKPIVSILQTAIENPEMLITDYCKVWSEQFNYHDGHIEHYYSIRKDFNGGLQTPEIMLYLLARCVKGAVRYGKNGLFNQSPDKRRHGVNPKNMKRNVLAISQLLKGKASFSSLDYREIFEMAKPGDLVYMDPPYQGVSEDKDSRYCAGLDYDEFVNSLDILNRKGVDYIVSYDGVCGKKVYGKELPCELECSKVLLNAGLSAQATLLGRREITYEALYLSKALSPIIAEIPQQLSFWEVAAI
jgi:DNA adenine methylase